MKVAVIGAGATGLVSAYLLAKAGHDVTILEASNIPGGLLSTFDAGDGARLEYYYHHFFTHDAEINWLLKELGLADQVSFLPTTMGMLRNGEIHDFNGVSDLLKFSAIPMVDRLRFAASSAMLVYAKGYAEAEDVSSLHWFNKWAGKAATESIWRPMLEIKFGESASRVPLAWMAGRLRQRARSRDGSQEKLGYLRGSLQILVDRLVSEIKSLGVKIQLGVPTKRFLFDEDGAVVGIETTAGAFKADRVLATVPTPILADWLKADAPQYAKSLDRIKYIAATCTVLSLDKKLSPVYWLNVADPDYDFGGVIEQTNLVPSSNYGGQHLVYLSRYHEWDHPMASMSDETLIERQSTQLERLFKTEVKNHTKKSWVFRAKYAAPKVEIGFHRDIPDFKSPIPNLYVAAMPHVYPDERSVNNSIRVASQVTAEMGVDTSYVPSHMSLAAKYGRAA
ncbi:MAG: NAD(P)/FAD-dependent oxidoreductase [Planctomycetota bacterium]|nr:NAD(P)/FAD-dependent oxidoreductase [Planctomycetota bacterium]